MASGVQMEAKSVEEAGAAEEEAALAPQPTNATQANEAAKAAEISFFIRFFSFLHTLNQCIFNFPLCLGTALV